MAMYLVITDGTTTVTIADGSGGATNYVLTRGTWSPQIAGLRRSLLSGRGPYNDVIEEMQLNITGSTPAAAMTNLSTLVALLEQAERWYKGENVSPVLIKYSPDGASVSSSGSPLQAAILGRAPGDETSTRLSPNFDDLGGQGWVLDVTIRFWRRGLWLHTVDSASSSATTNGDLITVTMAGAQTYPGPFTLQLTQVYDGDDSSVFYKPGFIAVCEASTDIEIINAESLATGALTSVSDSTKYARNTNVLRYTPAGTSAVYSTSTNLSVTGNRLAVYASVRSNNSAITYKIQADLRSSNSPTPSASSPEIGSISLSNPIIVPSTSPTWVFLGILSSPSTDFDSFRILVQASAATGSFDIDTIVVVGLGNFNNTVLEIGRDYHHSSTYGATESIVVDHGALTFISPTARTKTTGTIRNWPTTIYGNGYLSNKSASVYVLHMATGGGSTADRWRYENSAAVLTQTATISRYAAYLTPV